MEYQAVRVEGEEKVGKIGIFRRFVFTRLYRKTPQQAITIPPTLNAN